MAVTAAAVKARSLISASSLSSSYILISKRFLSSSFSITRPIPRPSLYLSRSLQPYIFRQFSSSTSIRRRFNHSDLDYRYLPEVLAELNPGCDFKHWLIVMEEPGGQGATKQQMIDSYVQTLARVLRSEEEAKKKIYSISCSKYFGFGCEIDEETSERLKELPGVLFVLPDTYVDRENKEYGGEPYVNGEIVQRSPERQMRMEAFMRRARYDPEVALMIKSGLSISDWECK